MIPSRTFFNFQTFANAYRWLQPKETYLIMNAFEDLLKELYKFSDTILSLGDPIDDNRLEDFEKCLGYELPSDFKFIITRHNSFSIAGTEVLGVGEDLQEESIEQVYKFEHDEVGNPMPPSFLPFSPDGFGNHYCFNLGKLNNGICPVIFWQHDCVYSNEDEAEVCNANFIEWVKEVMIDWTLEDINYDGSDKA